MLAPVMLFGTPSLFPAGKASQESIDEYDSDPYLEGRRKEHERDGAIVGAGATIGRYDYQPEIDTEKYPLVLKPLTCDNNSCHEDEFTGSAYGGYISIGYQKAIGYDRLFESYPDKFFRPRYELGLISLGQEEYVAGSDDGATYKIQPYFAVQNSMLFEFALGGWKKSTPMFAVAAGPRISTIFYSEVETENGDIIKEGFASRTQLNLDTRMTVSIPLSDALRLNFGWNLLEGALSQDLWIFNGRLGAEVDLSEL
jgi:hypothetical protein